jgi:ABC-type multidrug transport system fused ATPase/permease subunit
VAEICGKIQDGMGRKVGDSIQYITQIIGSFAVAFYLSWRLTVVLIAAFPIIAGAGAYRNVFSAFSFMPCTVPPISFYTRSLHAPALQYD